MEDRQDLWIGHCETYALDWRFEAATHRLSRSSDDMLKLQGLYAVFPAHRLYSTIYQSQRLTSFAWYYGTHAKRTQLQGNVD